MGKTQAIMFLSIIVPVYNVKPYLERCVQSLLDQDLEREDYEVILVDDGSTDGSGLICDGLAAHEPNIQVIHKENGGLSSARNAGIRVASGDYILFVDSDDYLVPCVLNGLRKQIDSQGLDILRFNYQNVNENGEVFEPNKESKPFVDFSTDVCDGITFLTERLGFACYAWQFIVRTELLKNERCPFTHGIYFEDVDWTPRLLLQVQKVSSTSLVVYNYLFRSGSITRTADIRKQKKKLTDRLNLIDTLQQLEQNCKRPDWFQGMISQIALSIVTTAGLSFYPERKTILKTLRSKGVFPLSTYHATPSAARKIRLTNLSPELMCCLLHLRNR